MNLTNKRNLLIVILILIILIFFVTGFLIGYVFADKSCITNPFSYAVKKISTINGVNFSCSCFDLNGKVNPFTFDKDGISLN